MRNNQLYVGTGMCNKIVKLRAATVTDLTAINYIIGAAVMGWDLPERVKRLSLPSYHYTPHDLDSLELIVALDVNQQIVAVAAWEPADPKDLPQGQRALLLHGLYVKPECQHQGIGQTLLRAAERTARDQKYDGLLVKAQESARGFFQAQNMKPLNVENENRDYANRFWKSTSER